jgi:cation:H+ antiporter
MDILLNFGCLLIGLILLIYGGDFLVRGASNVAYKAKLSPMVVGLTIVAMGTSAPEFVVSVGAVHENPGIAIGNIVGSNICNLAFILGVTAAICPIKVSFKDIKIDWFMCLGSGLLLYFFLSGDAQLNAFEGFILILIAIIYTYYLVEMSRSESANKTGEEEIDPELKNDLEKAYNSKTIVEVGFIVLGIIVLYFGGEFFVKGAVNIAKSLNISEDIIGLTIVALGTSAPELITSIIAARKNNTDLALGNLMGSNIFNILGILGVTSLIANVNVKQSIISFDMLVMLAIVLVTLPMILKGKISRFEGWILMFIYFAYTAYMVFEAINGTAS